MEKEQKTGLFRRLFGGNNEDNTKLDNPPQNVKEQNEKTTEVTTVPKGNILSGVGSHVSEPMVEDRIPTWEELLNKIAPPGKQENAQAVEKVQLPAEEMAPNSADPNFVQTPDPESVETPKDLHEQISSIERELISSVERESISSVERESISSVERESISSVERESISNIEREPIRLPKVKTPIKHEHVTWLLDQAIEATSLGDMDKAEKFLEIALTLEKHPDVTLALAKHELFVHNFEKATRYCVDTLIGYPDSLEAAELLEDLVSQGVNPDLQNLIELDSSNPDVNRKLAELFLGLEQLAPALSHFAKAQAQGLDVNSIQYQLGLLYEKMGNPSQAKEHYQSALHLGGKRNVLEAACRLFDLNVQLGLMNEAKELAKKYLQGNQLPEVTERVGNFYFREGEELFAKGDLEAALDCYYTAFEQGNVQAKDGAIKTLCSIAANSLSVEKTLEYYEAALDIGGFDREIVERVAETYFQQNNYTKALEQFRVLYENTPEDPQIVDRYATCLQKSGNLEGAATLLESLGEAGKLSQNARELLFDHYRSQGRYEDAKRHFELLYEQGTAEYEKGLQTLAWDQIRFMEQNGDAEKAWQICCQELQAKPSTDMLGLAMKILSGLVDSLVAENKINEALQELEHGRTLGLDLLDLGLREASLYESIGKDLEALRVYEIIARKAPEVWDKIKEIYLKAATREYLAGNLAEAKRLLEDALAKMPQNAEISRALGVLYQETGQYVLAAALAQDTLEETDIQVSTDHLNILRPHGYRRIRLG